MMNAGQGNRRTHILFLKRFMPSGHNFISNERRLCDILAAAPNNMLPVLYIRQTMVQMPHPLSHIVISVVLCTLVLHIYTCTCTV